MRRMYRSCGLLLLLVTVSACSASGSSPGPDGTNAETGSPSGPPGLEGSIDPAVPESLVQAAAADAAARAGQQGGTVRVIRAQPTTWNDGSLGCPRPGEFYTQALVDGYWIVLEVAGQTYDYRAAARGAGFRLCEEPGASPGGADTY
jgi:hypothetical protein